MITRGYLIGKIVDELGGISSQIDDRAKLKLYDLNIFLENFFRDVLNIIFDYQLTNLNEKRSNNPGIDLGDIKSGVCFQVTSTKTAKKIEETLEKAVNQIKEYPILYVLILRKKQSSYKIESRYSKPFNFKSDTHILDIQDLLKKIIGLQLEPLQRLYDLVSQDSARVKIELEIPNKAGKYKTNIQSYIEDIPKEKFKGISKYYKFLCDQDSSGVYEVSKENVTKDFIKFMELLAKLPRITRQFYAFLLNRGNINGSRIQFNADYLKRVCSYPDMPGELRLLDEIGLCWFSEPDEYGESAKWIVDTVRKAKSNDFTLEFMEYVKLNNLSLEKAIVSLDFSDFD